MRLSSILLLALCTSAGGAPPIPTKLTPQPFVPVELATSSAPFSIGKIRTIRPLQTVGAIDDFYFEAPRRIAISTPAGWRLVDPMTDRVIARIDHPDDLLSPNELVIRNARSFDSVVALDTGAITRPVPKLPINAPLESMYIVHSREGGGDVFLMATAANRTFVGLWNDRALAPSLVHEIELRTGWEAHRREEGLELTTPVGKTCKGIRLHRLRPPECMATYDFYDTAITGTWELDLQKRSDGKHELVAHDQATGREEMIEVDCKWAGLAASRTSPRALVHCGVDDPVSAIGWTPGRANVLRGPSRRINGHAEIAGAFAFENRQAGQEYWFDVDHGTVMHGPPLEDLDADRSDHPIAISGKGAATKIMVIDAATHTVRLAIAAPCPGEVLLDEVKPRYTALSCGIADRPGYFDFARVWTKVIDTRESKVYNLPGYASAIFDDGTAILSNRTRLTAETRGPNARMWVVALE